MFDIQLDSIIDPFAIEVSGSKTSFVSTGTAHVRFRIALRTEPTVYSSMQVRSSFFRKSLPFELTPTSQTA
jgi:hypothetical protein